MRQALDVTPVVVVMGARQTGKTTLVRISSASTTPVGAHLENLVFTDLNAWRATAERSPEILYWRTTGGQEVDFVVETADRLLPMEVSAMIPHHSMAIVRSERAEIADLRACESVQQGAKPN